MTVTLDALALDIRQRLDGISEDLSARTSDVALTGIVRGIIESLGDDPEFQRKMRFGAGADDGKLVGTKYRRWGLSVADIEFLHELQTSLKGQKKVNAVGIYEGPSETLNSTFGQVTDAYYLPEAQVRELDRKAIDDMFPRLPLTMFHGPDRALARRGAWEQTTAYQQAMVALADTGAMDTAESGFGQQLIGAQYVGTLWDAARRDSRVFGLIESFEMTDPTAFLPVEVDIPEMLFVPESTTYDNTTGLPTAGAYATVKTGSNRVQVNAKKFLIHQVWSGEIDEDSIIPFVPFLRRQAATSIAHYSDSLVLNGDDTASATGNINSDDQTPGATKHYLAFDGIRHAYIVDNTANAVDGAAGYPTLVKLHTLRGLMLDRPRLVDWGHPADPNDLVYVSDPETADRIALIDEVLTVDKYGPQATVLTGEIAKIARYPLVGAMAMNLTAADGKSDAATPANNIKGGCLAFNRRGFKTGWRRRVMVETERLPATDQTRLVYSLRLGFGRFSPTGAASAIEAVAALYNLLVT
ncbi:MAG TPA: hypothetical protein VG276_27980 [Actinomycetes bacterium]|jgi:hypothetical protein|nr:hypothetical protein [Actinomycetes bacterium]